jgi:hypothetical protein
VELASSRKECGVLSAIRSKPLLPLFSCTPLTNQNPSYLGDAFIHTSFIVLLYGSDMLAPVELLGPLANYLFLRFFGGDAQKEKSQTRRYSASQPEKFAELERFRGEKNAFWPATKELSNKWVWTVLGLGAVGVVVEEMLRTLH